MILSLLLFVSPSASAGVRGGERSQVMHRIVVGTQETAQDVFCFGCSIRVLGDVEGDAVTIGGALEVRGRVRGDALAMGGEIHLAPGAEISGDAIAFGGRVVSDPGARLAGEEQSLPYLPVPGQRQLRWRGLLGLAAINSAAALFGVALLRRRRLATLVEAVTRHAALTVLAGAVASVVAVLLYQGAGYLGPAENIVMLLVTLVLAFVWVTGFAGTSAWLGARLQARTQPASAALLGALLITVLELIPLAGFVVWCVVALLAVGGALITRFGRPAAATTSAQVVANAAPPVL